MHQEKNSTANKYPSSLFPDQMFSACLYMCSFCSCCRHNQSFRSDTAVLNKRRGHNQDLKFCSFYSTIGSLYAMLTHFIWVSTQGRLPRADKKKHTEKAEFFKRIHQNELSKKIRSSIRMPSHREKYIFWKRLQFWAARRALPPPRAPTHWSPITTYWSQFLSTAKILVLSMAKSQSSRFTDSMWI